jgi:lipopolysaccharide transport system ATP-binding protein
MNMAEIKLQNVTVDLPIFGSHNMNLKGHVASRLIRKKKAIEKVRALDDVSLEFKDGDRIGLVGSNGAGKTTLLRVAAGLLIPTVGDVSRIGKVITMLDSGIGIDNSCTGLENIYRKCIYSKLSPKEIDLIVDEVIEFSELENRIHHPLHSYSAGMKTRLTFAISIALKPEILLIDEGISMADSQFQTKAQIKLEALFKSSKILIVATHSEQLLDQYCNKRVLLSEGKVVVQ